MKQVVLSIMMLCGVLPNVGRSDVVFDIEDVVVVPGTQAVVGVFVYATAGEGLDAYNLPIEIGNNGRGFPAGIVGFSAGDFAQEVATFSNVVINTDTLAPGLTQNYEAIFRDNGARIALPTAANPRRLFNILIDTSLSLTGSVPVSISSTGNVGHDPLSITTSSGSFIAPTAPGLGLQLFGGSITAVPEPSAWAVLGLLGFIGFRRR